MYHDSLHNSTTQTSLKDSSNAWWNLLRRTIAAVVHVCVQMVIAWLPWATPMSSLLYTACLQNCSGMHPVLLSPAIRQVSLDVTQIPAASALVCTLTSIVRSAHLHCMSLDRQPVRRCCQTLPSWDAMLWWDWHFITEIGAPDFPTQYCHENRLLTFEHRLIDTRLVHLSPWQDA